MCFETWRSIQKVAPILGQWCEEITPPHQLRSNEHHLPTSKLNVKVSGSDCWVLWGSLCQALVFAPYSGPSLWLFASLPRYCRAPIRNARNSFSMPASPTNSWRNVRIVCHWERSLGVKFACGTKKTRAEKEAPLSVPCYLCGTNISIFLRHVLQVAKPHSCRRKRFRMR